MSSKKQLAAEAIVRLGGVPMLNTYWGKKRLTVLAYHRVTALEDGGFDDFRPMVSATPQLFDTEMAFVKAHFNVISLDDLRGAILHGNGLPDNPLLITFDGGYLDNYINAFPILKKYGFPAVIFLTTSRMNDTETPLWWDWVARVFHRTTQAQADLPLVGAVDLTGEAKHDALHTVMDALEAVPENEKLDTIAEIGAALGVTDVSGGPLFLNWEQAKELVNNGITCQSHTVDHPILTRISQSEVVRQIRDSRAAIMDHTGQEVYAFAYPSGTPADYAPETITALTAHGYDLAFTLTAGPMRWEAVKANPLQIRRVYLDNKDTLQVFAVKVMGVPAFLEPLAYPEMG
jgi:peptidoglycan/xylan/chitin deacetylase (PgdA/CDA1 family)